MYSQIGNAEKIRKVLVWFLHQGMNQENHQQGMKIFRKKEQ